MKRRNPCPTLVRRPLKKISTTKMSDGLYYNLVMYFKLFILWMCVMGGDFILEFRIEYLYPVYLLIHNSYEAYKFQSFAFALLLVCIHVSVDVICLGILPAQWLYLLGSLAVWMEIGWSLTPLGPLLLVPSLIYIDGKALRPEPSLPLTPLAAHCVGFPLVSLGFGLKSYIGNKLKQRTKNDVARSNELLYSILWEGLPPPPTNTIVSTPINNNEVIKNGDAVLVKKQQSLTDRRKSVEELSKVEEKIYPPVPVSNNHVNHNNANSSVSNPFLNSSSASASTANHTNSNGSQLLTPSYSNNSNSTLGVLQGTTSPPICSCMQLQPKKKKDDCCLKLESEVRKLRSEKLRSESDLHSIRTVESELRGQICSLLTFERNLRADLASIQGQHESLQLKYSALVSKSQEERQNFEKKLLAAVNKQKKVSQSCDGDCKRKLRDAEKEKESLRREIKLIEDKNTRTERELQNVKSTLLHEQKNKEVNTETARLVSLLQALQDQNSHLEQSLSAETRLKLDLFSALGEARRQLSIQNSTLKLKEDELEDLRGQLVDAYSVSDFSGGHHHHNHNNHNNHSLLSSKNSMNSLGMGNQSSQQQNSNDSLNFSPSTLIES